MDDYVSKPVRPHELKRALVGAAEALSARKADQPLSPAQPAAAATSPVLPAPATLAPSLSMPPPAAPAPVQPVLSTPSTSAPAPSAEPVLTMTTASSSEPTPPAAAQQRPIRKPNTEARRAKALAAARAALEAAETEPPKRDAFDSSALEFVLPPEPAEALTIAREMFDGFFSESSDRLVDLQKAAETADIDTANHISHRLKGACSMIGFREIEQITAAIETDARAGKPADPEAVAKLTPAFEAARDSANRWIADLAKRAGQ
jgi:HPt (histidine-containing phosphotransfer) domain-containing protein